MTRAQKLLYHQIHPLKLLTDVAGSFASTALLWEAHWTSAALVGFGPSILVSAVLLWRADLEPFQRTPLGRYIANYMTPKITALRSGGQALMWIGAAIHIAWLVPLGFMIIVFAWLNGLWDPTQPARRSG
jgi:hypothetical protein